MPNIFDYLEWRCDIPFEVDPFNDVDNLILAELVYTAFEGSVPEDGKRITLKSACDAYFTLHSREEAEQSSEFMVRAPLLMDRMLEGRRFAGMQISDYVNIVDVSRDMQMAAVTCILPDKTAYVAYRGTDNTIVGWKEDFNMSWLPETGGQREALLYLNRIGRKLRRPLRVGGHSKGGNLAVYAAAFCDPKVRERITDVYSNDGPGFRPEITESEGYRKILPRVRSIVPEDSVIGMLLSSAAEMSVVESSAKLFAQHDGMTWQVRRNSFVPAERSEFARFVDEAHTDWLNKIDDSSREAFVNALFSMIEATGAVTFDKMGDQKLRSIERIISSAQGMDRQTQQMLLRIGGELLQSSGSIVKKSISHRINEDNNK